MLIIKYFRKFKFFLKKNILHFSIPLFFNEDERIFYSKNRNFWRRSFSKNKKNKNAIVIEYVPFSHVGIGVLFLASIVSIIRKAKIIAVVIDPNISKENFSDFMYYSFPNVSFHFVSDTIKTNKNKIRQNSLKIYEGLKTVDDILKINYNGLQIGDIIYDSSQRLIPQSASVWEIDGRIYKTIFNSIALYETLNYINNNFEIVSSCSSHCVGISSIIIRYYSFIGIESFVGAAGLGPISKHSDFNNHRVEFHLQINNEIIEKILNDKTLKSNFLSKAESFLNTRINGENLDFDSSNAYRNKKIFNSKIEFKNYFGIRNNNPIVFIMLHAFNDYPNHYEKGVYIDYYVWFVETLKKVKKLKKINWIFKEHPSSVNYPNDANVNGIFDVCNENHILFLNHEENFSTKSLINICDQIITCTGTAGLEMTCFGIPCLLTQPNHYSTYGLCDLVKTDEEYSLYLDNLNTSGIKKKISKFDIEKSKILFYILYKCISDNENQNFLFKKTTHADRQKNYRHLILNEFNNLELKNEDLNFYKDFISKNYRRRLWSSNELIKIEKEIFNTKK